MHSEQLLFLPFCPFFYFSNSFRVIVINFYKGCAINLAYSPLLLWFFYITYRILANATPHLNRAPGNVKSPVMVFFLEQNPTFLLLKCLLFERFFKLNLNQNPILKNKTLGLHQRGYGTQKKYICTFRVWIYVNIRNGLNAAFIFLFYIMTCNLVIWGDL